MTQSIDEQLRRAFDSLAEQLRTTLSEHASTTVAQVAAAAAERQTMADAAAREAVVRAERELAERLTASFSQREDQIRDAARREGLDAGLQQARAEALAIQDAREAEAQLAADAAARTAAQKDADHAAALAAAQQQVADHAEALAAAHAVAQTTVPVVDHGAVERLLAAVRALDATTSLSQALDALGAAARADADRVAIFLLRGDVLRAWMHAGFEVMSGGPTFEVPLAQAGIAADAIRAAASTRITAQGEGRPPFAGDASTGALVAVPLAMNGQVIAVLCGEQLSAMDDGAGLATTFEVLARHAARVLESLTALRLAQLGAQPSASAAVLPA